MKRPSPLQSPWWVVLGASLGLTVGSLTVLQFAFSMLIKPISAEFGWGRTTVSLAISVATILSAVGTPFIGRLVDRWGVKPVTLLAITVFSMATALMSCTPANAAAFIALSAGLGLAGAGQGPLAYAKAISGAFDKRRGLALGVGMVGVGVGAALLPRFAQALMESFGWRGAFIGLGLLIFGVAFPAVALLLREPGAQPLTLAATQHSAEQAMDTGLTASEVLRTPSFWMLVAVFVFVPMACNGTIVHLHALFTDRGLPAAAAAQAFSSIGVSVIAGRLLCGALLDRYFAPHVAMLFVALPAIGILLLAVGEGSGAQSAGAAMVGAGLGAEIDLVAYLQSRYFGMRAFGQVYGYLFMAFAVGAGLGPLAMGLAFDYAGSYQAVLISFFALLALAIYFLSRLPRRYPYPVRTGPV